MVLIMIAQIILIVCCIVDFMLIMRNKKYQKKWNKKKSDRLRIDPGITRAEMCEEYVYFCKKNDCFGIGF